MSALDPLLEIDTVARTLEGEAGGEPWKGLLGVGHVVRNRVMADLLGDGKPDWWGEGWVGVCRKPFQFSCWNPDDPVHPRIVAATLNQRSFRRSYAAALLVYDNVLPDPTGGASHYHTVARPPWAKSWPPKWAATMPQTTVIERHAFYRDPAMGAIKEA